MDRQTLRDWVHRYNAVGVAGLATATRPGRPPALNEAQMAELKEHGASKGPDPERHKVVRWRCVDLREEIAAPLFGHSDQRNGRQVAAQASG